MPFTRLAHGRLIVNPGSVGMPYGRAGAHWALLADGAVTLRRTVYDAEAAGNISPPVLAAALERPTPPAAWVLELSSYQLETTWSLDPRAATMLNLSLIRRAILASLAPKANCTRYFASSFSRNLPKIQRASRAFGQVSRLLFSARRGSKRSTLRLDFG